MKKTILAFVASAGLLFATSSANATVIDFEEIAGNDFVSGTDTLNSQGYNFFNNCTDGPDCFGHWARGSDYNADGNGRTVFLNYSYTTTTLTQIGGDLFDLVSIDFADVYDYNIFNEHSGILPTEIRIEVIGTKAGGDTLTETLLLDSVSGLEKFDFNWTELATVTWTELVNDAPTDGIKVAKGFQFDNVVVNASDSGREQETQLPEPAPMALLGLGLLGLAAARRKRA